MKIINKTEWNTKDLMKLIRAVAKKEGLSIKKHTIRIIHSKNSDGASRYCGLAPLGIQHKDNFHSDEDAEYGNGRWVKMRVPPYLQNSFLIGSNGKWSKEKKAVPFDSVRFAKVLTHEFGHNTGLRHNEMLDLCDFDCDWAKDFIVNPSGV